MKDLLLGKEIDGKTFAIDSICSAKDIIPFPLKVVDLSAATNVTNPQEYIGIRQQTPPNQLIASMNKTGIWNIVQFSQSDIEQKLRVAGRINLDPKAFLNSPGKHFFESGLKSEKIKASGEQRFAFRASSQKRYILNMINNYVFSVPGAKALGESIISVADELFTNALYNAPFGEKDYSLDRTTMVFLDPALSPEMIISHNSKHLFLGCLDHFGSFDCEEFLKRSAQAKKITAEDFVKLDVGGAGLGMMRIIDLAPDIFVVVEKNKQTFIGCLFPLNVSSKKIKLTSRNLFFKSFETLGDEPNTVVIERRGSTALLKLKGRFDSQIPFHEINFEGVTEISLDMRQLNEIICEDFGKFMSALKSEGSLRKASFDLLHPILVSDVLKLMGENQGLFRIGSLWETVVCKGCQATQNIVMKPLEAGKTASPRESFECPGCGEVL